MSGKPLELTFSDMMTWVGDQTGAIVNFADLCGISQEVPCLRLQPKQYYHHGPYCEFAKLNGNLPKCVINKKHTVRFAREHKTGFASLCPEGIWDWIQPVWYKNELIGIFYLGSWRGRYELNTIRGKSYSGAPIPFVVSALKREVRHSARLLAEVMLLIISQWVQSGNRLSKHKPSDFYRHAVQLYIQNHYHEDVKLQDLARQLKLHQNYLGRMIATLFGNSFRSLLMNYRIDKARVLLSSRHYIITEIAFACGFNDSNYFSVVFRNKVGLSPRDYRNQQLAPHR